MIVECPNCHVKYNVPDDKIKGRKKLKCSKCKTIFTIRQPSEDSSESKKDTAKITTKNITDSLWSDENLRLPDDKKISIAIIKGARAGFVYKVLKPYISIGRGKVDLIIPDKEVSRKHCALEIREDKIILRDLGSTNGTFIKNKKISIAEIENQTEFKIGQTTLLLIITSKDDQI